jgi:hypothetical protein
MDRKLQLLDSFKAEGNDGVAYKVMAYEHLLRVDLLGAGQEQWEPTGLTEYRLASGERVDVAPDGAMRVLSTGVVLHPADEGATPTAQAEARH